MQRLRPLLDNLCDYARCLFLWSGLFSVVCLFLSALTRYLAPGGNFLRLSALSAGFWEASYATLAAGMAAAILCELIWRDSVD